MKMMKKPVFALALAVSLLVLIDGAMTGVLADDRHSSTPATSSTVPDSLSILRSFAKHVADQLPDAQIVYIGRPRSSEDFLKISDIVQSEDTPGRFWFVEETFFPDDDLGGGLDKVGPPWRAVTFAGEDEIGCVSYQTADSFSVICSPFSPNSFSTVSDKTGVESKENTDFYAISAKGLTELLHKAATCDLLMEQHPELKEDLTNVGEIEIGGCDGKGGIRIEWVRPRK